MTTIADSLAPEVLEMLGQEFLSSLEETTNTTFGCEELDDYMAIAEGYWDCADHIEDVMGCKTGATLWHSLWLFGLVLEDDVFSSLGNYWQPDGVVANGYYVPDDFDTNVPLVSIDKPPTVAVAWDAK